MDNISLIDSFNENNLNYELYEIKLKEKKIFDIVNTYNYQKLQFFNNGFSFQTKRDICAYADRNVQYIFSNNFVLVNKWTKELLDIKNQIEEITKTTFNYCLINRYANGLSQISSHKDNEKSIDSIAPIACLSLGVTRKFIFTRPKYKTKQIYLKNNSLLIMNYPTNKFWFHSIPIQKSVKNCRISLTFRKII